MVTFDNFLEHTRLDLFGGSTKIGKPIEDPKENMGNRSWGLRGSGGPFFDNSTELCAVMKPKNLNFYDFRGWWKCQGPPNTTMLDSGAIELLKLNQEKYKIILIRYVKSQNLENKKNVLENPRYWSHRFLKSMNMGSIP